MLLCVASRATLLVCKSSVDLLGVLADRGDILAAELYIERAEVVLQVLQVY